VERGKPRRELLAHRRAHPRVERDLLTRDHPFGDPHGSSGSSPLSQETLGARRADTSTRSAQARDVGQGT
jgi:hypothetical protein